jgi:hypothetical protein
VADEFDEYGLAFLVSEFCAKIQQLKNKKAKTFKLVGYSEILQY